MSKAGASLATCYGPVSADVMAKAENIRLLILDVDGVLSDGLIYMGNNGEELKAFNVRDGLQHFIHKYFIRPSTILAHITPTFAADLDKPQIRN